MLLMLVLKLQIFECEVAWKSCEYVVILAWGIVEKIIYDSYGAMLNCGKCGFWLCNIFDG